MDRRDGDKLPSSSLPVSLLPHLLRDSSTRTTIPDGEDDEQELPRPPTPPPLPPYMPLPMYPAERRRASVPYAGYELPPPPPPPILPNLEPSVRHHSAGSSSIHHGPRRTEYHSRGALNYIPPVLDPIHVPPPPRTQWREGEAGPSAHYASDHRAMPRNIYPPPARYPYDDVPPVMTYHRDQPPRRAPYPPPPPPVQPPPGAYERMYNPDPRFRDEFFPPRLPSLADAPSSWPPQEHDETWHEERMSSPESKDDDGDYKPSGSAKSRGKKRTKPLAGGQAKRAKTSTGTDAPKLAKIDIACDHCRQRKLRCDGLRPSCGSCTSRQVKCEYAAAPKRRGQGKKKKAKLEAAAGLDPSVTRDVFDFQQGEPFPPASSSEGASATPPFHRQSSRYSTEGSSTPRGRSARRRSGTSPPDKSPKAES